MPRNMSFFLTQEQIRNQTKTVTRRLGWKFLEPGTILNACVKCQGLGKGGKIERICQIRVTDVRLERLDKMDDWRKSGRAYGIAEAELEGFPDLDGIAFVEMFRRHMKCTPDTQVTRILFEYMDGAQ